LLIRFRSDSEEEVKIQCTIFKEQLVGNIDILLIDCNWSITRLNLSLTLQVGVDLRREVNVLVTRSKPQTKPTPTPTPTPHQPEAQSEAPSILEPVLFEEDDEFALTDDYGMTLLLELVTLQIHF
jgi:hypothetical protein